MGSQASKPTLAATSIKIERSRWDRFKEVAKANERSVSGQLRWVIDRSIQEHEEEAAA